MLLVWCCVVHSVGLGSGVWCDSRRMDVAGRLFAQVCMVV